MVLGKLSILLLISVTAQAEKAQAENIWKPKFFEYRSNSPVDRVFDFTFGWNKKLNEAQQDAYYQSIVHAVEYAENGEKVQWYRDNASGYTTPVMTWPTGHGYCRRLHIDIIAHGMRKAMSASACYNNVTTNWTWYSDK